MKVKNGYIFLVGLIIYFLCFWFIPESTTTEEYVPIKVRMALALFLLASLGVIISIVIGVLYLTAEIVRIFIRWINEETQLWKPKKKKEFEDMTEDEKEFLREHREKNKVTF